MLGKGYDDWLSRFPMQTTNPPANVVLKPVASSTDFSPGIFLSCNFFTFHNSFHFCRYLVDDIVYSDLDEAMKPPKSTEIISQPLVNRTTKPALEAKQIEEPYVELPTQPVPLPRSIIPRTPSVDKGSTDTALRTVPQIDRNLKMGAMVKYLQDQEKMVEKHLAMTVERLKQEKEWDRIRSEKEASANSEIVNHLQEREETMIEVLKKMENDRQQVFPFV